MNVMNISFKSHCTRLVILWAVAVTLLGVANAQTFTTLANFDGSNGGNSLATMVQGTDGRLYGTAYVGGGNGKGLVFKITTTGALTTVHSFDGTDGQNPTGGLVVGESGSLYGTTYVGGAFGQNMNGYGVVFRIGNSGNFSLLQSLDGTDGQNPEAGLATYFSAGTYFGTARLGGLSGDGTVFKVTHSGVITTLHDFDLTDGQWPIGGVALGDDGNLYGTTCAGGSNFAGTVFRVTPSGSFTTLHEFDGTDGNCSVASLVRGNDGNFYGTASGGGSNSAGTVFRIGPSGAFTVLYNFEGSDGNGPGTLTLGNDGNFYGATSNGGANNDGTLFEITPTGTLTVLHSFDAADGQNPYAGLVQHTNGIFYGVTYSGGSAGDGTIFSLNLGLPQFVSLESTFGKAGTVIGVLGQDFKDATDVSFNGVPATFSVYTNGYLNARVPTGATSGWVTVTTKQRTFTSAQRFQVKQ